MIFWGSWLLALSVRIIISCRYVCGTRRWKPGKIEVGRFLYSLPGPQSRHRIERWIKKQNTSKKLLAGRSLKVVSLLPMLSFLLLLFFLFFQVLGLPVSAVSSGGGFVIFRQVKFPASNLRVASVEVGNFTEEDVQERVGGEKL